MSWLINKLDSAWVKLNNEPFEVQLNSKLLATQKQPHRYQFHFQDSIFLLPNKSNWCSVTDLGMPVKSAAWILVHIAYGSWTNESLPGQPQKLTSKLLITLSYKVSLQSNKFLDPKQCCQYVNATKKKLETVAHWIQSGISVQSHWVIKSHSCQLYSETLSNVANTFMLPKTKLEAVAH